MAIANCPAARTRKSTSSGRIEFSTRLPSVSTPSVRPRLIRGQSAARLEGFGANFSRLLWGASLFTDEIQYDRLAGLEYRADHGPFDRLHRILLSESLTLREVHGELTQMDVLGIWQPHPNDVAMHDLPNARRHRAEKIATL